MQSQTKEKLAYRASLALLFSYLEAIFPRPLPFLRFGFGNIALLLSFELPFFDFLLLCLLKSLASSLVSGTLFSPFFLISVSQTFVSGICMYLLAILNRKSDEKIFSVYGISVFGSCVSATVQIFACVLYLGRGVLGLLGPMMVFNVFSALVTAFFSTRIDVVGLPSESDFLREISDDSAELDENENLGKKPHTQYFFAVVLLFLIGSVFFIKNLYVLIFFLFSAFFAQIVCKRKIFILPHIFMWIFILLSSVFEPAGKIIFKIWRFSFTSDAFLLAVQKSLRLSIALSLSQCAFLIRPPKNSLLDLTIRFYKKMTKTGLWNRFS